MVSDPRCPHCSGKVSATATWCMHCGEDFDNPIDADSGRTVDSRRDSRQDFEEALHRGDPDAVSAALEESSAGAKVVGVFLSFVALLTLPLVSPPNVTLLYLVAVVGIGLYAARQPSAGDAIRDGGTALAVAPFALWLFSPVTNGLASLTFGSLIGPIGYAIVVSMISRRVSSVDS